MTPAQRITENHPRGRWDSRRGEGLIDVHLNGGQHNAIVRDSDRSSGDVYLHTFNGDDALAIKRRWRAWGWLDDKPPQPSRNILKPSEAVRRQDDAERVRTNRWLWTNRCHLPCGTPAERHAREFRHMRHRIDGERLGLPGTMAWLPANPPRHPYGAVVWAGGCPEEDADGQLFMRAGDVGRIALEYITADGAKAPVSPQKITRGRTDGKPFVVAAPNDLGGLVIAEGSWTALAMHADTGLGAWFSGGAAGMPALADAVPPYVESVTVAIEDDAAGRRYGNQLVDRLERRGVEAIRYMCAPKTAEAAA